MKIPFNQSFVFVFCLGRILSWSLFLRHPHHQELQHPTVITFILRFTLVRDARAPTTDSIPNPLPVKSLSHSVSKSVTKAKQAMIMLSSLPAHNFVLFALLSCKYIYLHFLQTGFLLLEKYLIVSFVSIIGSLFVLLSLFQYGKKPISSNHIQSSIPPSLPNSFSNLKKVCHYSFGQEAHFVVRPHHSSTPLHRYIFP